MEPETEQKMRLVLFGAVALLALNGAVNLYLDVYAAGHPLHVLFEVVTIVVGMGAAGVLGAAWLEDLMLPDQERESIQVSDRSDPKPVGAESVGGSARLRPGKGRPARVPDNEQDE